MFSFTNDLFLLDELVWFAPMFPHFIDAWEKRNHPNMHFLFYEDLKKVKQLLPQRSCQIFKFD